MGSEVNVTNATFQKEVLESAVPVLADFWAEWCVPCRMVSPVLTKLAEEHDGKVKVAKINVDQESELAMKFNIVSIPTILLFNKGEVAKQQIGAAPRKILEDMIKEYV
ncbi:MAG: thioredoxin [Spirochaetes bacterium RBG_16_67_19]|nr:MAG: thioredoxin [Spirochaetes bacterium RBG_16_67_19]